MAETTVPDKQARAPRILVTGSRNWSNRYVIHRALSEAWDSVGRHPDATLVHGACHLGGADQIAEEIWSAWGLPVERHPAAWHNGRLLGPRRNQAMVDLGADICLAFPLGESRGTVDCMQRAAKAGIPIHKHCIDAP